MGVHIGAQRHAKCSDQDFKCFAALIMRLTGN